MAYLLLQRSIVLTVFILLCFTVFDVSAQLQVNWDRSYGGRGDETLVDILPLDNGDYLLAGTSTSPVSGNKSAEPKGWMDYYVIRVDAHGEIIWDQTYGGDKRDELTSVIRTSDGNFLLAGHSTSGISGDKSEDSRGDADYWIVMIDQDGNLLWERTYGGDGNDFLKQVIESPDGGFVLGGISFSGISGEKSEPQKRPGVGFHTSDNWIIRLDKYGSRIWDRTLGGDDADRFEIMQYEDNAISFYSIYWDANWPEMGNSDIIFTPLNTSDFGGIWSCELNDLSGEIRYQNHTGINSYGYFIFKILSIGPTDLRVIQSNYDRHSSVGNEIYFPKELNKYSRNFPSKDQIYQGTPLPGIITDYDELEKEEGNFLSIYETFKNENSAHTDLKISNLYLGGDNDEKDPRIVGGNGSGLLVGSTSFSNKNLDGYKTEDSYGGSDIWIVNLSNIPPFSNLAGMDSLTSIVKTSDNGYLVIGASDSDRSGIKSENSRGGMDYWIIKFNSEGMVEWERTLGGNGDDIPVSAIESSNSKRREDPSFIIAGYSDSNRSGEKTSFRRGSSDLWVVKLDHSGNLIWNEIYGERRKEIGGFLANDGSDKIYLLGSSNSDSYQDIKTEDSFGGFDFWLLNIDVKNGKKLWDRTFGGSLNDYATDLKVRYSNSYTHKTQELYLAGITYSKRSGNKLAYRNGPSDYWVVRTDNRGEYESDMNFGGSGKELNAQLALNKDLTYIVGGSSDSPANRWKNEEGSGGMDYWMVKANRYNEVIWEKTSGSTANDYLTAIKPTLDGYILSGYTDLNQIRLTKLNKDRSELETKEFDDLIGGYFILNQNEPLLGATNLNDNGNYHIFRSSLVQEEYFNPGVVWSKPVTSKLPSYDLRNEFVQLNDQNYFISISGYNTCCDYGNNAISISLERYDKSGEVVDLRQFQITLNVFSIYDVKYTMDQDGNFYLAVSDFYDGFEVIKINRNGTVLWRIHEKPRGVFNEINQLEFRNNKLYLSINLAKIGRLGTGQVILMNPDGEILNRIEREEDLYIIDNQLIDSGFLQLVETRTKDFLLQRLDDNGNIIWSKDVSEAGNISYAQEQILYTSFRTAIRRGSSGNHTINLAKYSVAGDLMWENEFAAKGINKVYGHLQGDRILLYGVKTPDNVEFIEAWNRGFNDIFVVGLDEKGRKEFEYTYGSAGNEYLNDIVVDERAIYMYINSSDSGISYDKTFKGRSWILKSQIPATNELLLHGISDLEAIEENSAEEFNALIYPNPVKSELSIIHNGTEFNSIEIYDLLGQAHTLRINKEGNGFKINVVNLPAGMYILVLSSESETSSLRFIKE